MTEIIRKVLINGRYLLCQFRNVYLHAEGEVLTSEIYDLLNNIALIVTERGNGMKVAFSGYDKDEIDALHLSDSVLEKKDVEDCVYEGKEVTISFGKWGVQVCK